MIKSEKLIDRLRMLAEGGEPEEKQTGLCSEIYLDFGMEGVSAASKHFASWKHYSGQVLYPVPSTHKDYTESQYYVYFNTKWEGEQGRFRRSLCAHVADQLEKENDRSN